MKNKKMCELCDPGSPHYSQDWWQICNLSEDDPWFHIVNDFKQGWDLARKLAKEGFDYGGVVLGEFSEAKKPEERIEYALSVVVNLLEEIETGISHKKNDPEFLWLWGEFQKGVATLLYAYPQFQKHQDLALQGKARNKDRARQWYALWFDWYIKNPNLKPNTRVGFDKYFEEIMDEIRTGKRICKNPSEKINLDKLLNDFASKKHSRTLNDHKTVIPVLPVSFTANVFSNPKFKIELKEALGNLSSYPPVGEENYPYSTK